MTKTQRVKRLRELTDQIQSLPKSPDRDRLLYEFRSRLVDVDTGVVPREMLPVEGLAPAPVPARRRPGATRPAPGLTVSLAPPEPPAGRPEHPAEPFWVAEWLVTDGVTPAPANRARRSA